MTADELRERVEAATAEGFELAQQGRVRHAYDPDVRRDLTERWEGLAVGPLGPHSPPTYRSPYENLLLEDDAGRWVHLRRRRAA